MNLYERSPAGTGDTNNLFYVKGIKDINISVLPTFSQKNKKIFFYTVTYFNFSFYFGQSIGHFLTLAKLLVQTSTYIQAPRRKDSSPM